MRRILAGMILLVVLPAGSAFAEEKYRTVRELYELYQGRCWQETYHANGRNVEVDCSVDIPDVSNFPVLTVQVMPPVEEPLYSALLQRYAAPKGTKLDLDKSGNEFSGFLFHVCQAMAGRERST